eukprot:1325459-Prymnesium_polylepis.1
MDCRRRANAWLHLGDAVRSPASSNAGCGRMSPAARSTRRRRLAVWLPREARRMPQQRSSRA